MRQTELFITGRPGAWKIETHTLDGEARSYIDTCELSADELRQEIWNWYGDSVDQVTISEDESENLP
jgi:hypothetical protein